MKAVAEWLDKNEYPFVSNYFTVNNTQQHYIDVGTGETLLFVHGTPSWSFDFRKLIKELLQQYRCIAVDHIGFGLSGKPADYDYSTQNHGKTLEAFIDHLQLKNISLVLHDFGGPIGFDYALKNPENISRIIVLNSWLWDSGAEPGFAKLKKILKSPLLPFLYRNFNFSARYLLPASFGEHKLPAKILQQYIKPFNKRSERTGPLAFARSLVNDQRWFEELWMQRSVLNTKPMLFIWGMKDKFITGNYLDKFISGFSNSFVKKLDTCGHFPQEECADEVTQSIKYFLTKDNQI
ncbi:MAG: alpha/beta fold hydrolase [Ferruginibacter sp.]|nr:alpha/beta fold hydrolase [Ferruginibacter sp.]